MSDAASAQRHILVVGAGFAGLYAAMGLRDAVADGHHVTVVNQESFFQYQPFLPEVASGTIDPRAAVVPLRRVLEHCRIVIGEVTRVDHSAREAHLRTAGGDERTIGYDVVCNRPKSVAYRAPGSPISASEPRSRLRPRRRRGPFDVDGQLTPLFRPAHAVARG